MAFVVICADLNYRKKIQKIAAVYETHLRLLDADKIDDAGQISLSFLYFNEILNLGNDVRGISSFLDESIVGGFYERSIVVRSGIGNCNPLFHDGTFDGHYNFVAGTPTGIQSFDLGSAEIEYFNASSCTLLRGADFRGFLLRFLDEGTSVFLLPVHLKKFFPAVVAQKVTMDRDLPLLSDGFPEGFFEAMEIAGEYFFLEEQFLRFHIAVSMARMTNTGYSIESFDDAVEGLSALAQDRRASLFSISAQTEVLIKLSSIIIFLTLLRLWRQSRQLVNHGESSNESYFEDIRDPIGIILVLCGIFLLPMLVVWSAIVFSSAVGLQIFIPFSDSALAFSDNLEVSVVDRSAYVFEAGLFDVNAKDIDLSDIVDVRSKFSLSGFSWLGSIILSYLISLNLLSFCSRIAAEK